MVSVVDVIQIYILSHTQVPTMCMMRLLICLLTQFLYFAIGYPQLRSAAHNTNVRDRDAKACARRNTAKFHACLTCKLPGPKRKLKWLGSFS
jgi:hypothetical protein